MVSTYLEICLEEQLLMKYYVIKHLILLKFQRILPRWIPKKFSPMVYRFFNKKSAPAVANTSYGFVKSELHQINN